MIQSFEHRHALGGRALYRSDAPDTSGEQELARTNAGLSKEELAWAKQVYADEKPARDAAAARANRVSDSQIANMDQATADSRDFADYNRTVFRPLEKGIVDDAQKYDTPERREAAAAAAGSDAQRAIDGQTGTMQRNLERSGVNPQSGASQAMAGSMALNGAKIRAGAENGARTNVETVGFARRMDAASLGRGLASSSATSASTAIQAGNAAAGNSVLSLTPGAQANAGLAQGYGSARQGNASAGAMYGNIANTQAGVNAGNDSSYAAAGTAVATIGIAI